MFVRERDCKYTNVEEIKAVFGILFMAGVLQFLAVYSEQLVK